MMIKRIFIIFGFWVLGLFTLMIISSKSSDFRNSVPRPPNESVEKSIQLTPVKHDDPVVLPHNMLCPQWAQIAIDVGWREEDLPMLDYVIHRESRCFTASYSNTDPNGGSYGLTQINGYWCNSSQWYPNGYLQVFGVLQQCEDLFHPRTNLLSARLIWLYSDKEYGNGWLPWQT
jgi:hypothetical protein